MPDADTPESVDTTTEAVERLAKWHDRLTTGGRWQQITATGALTSATLRALARERDIQYARAEAEHERARGALARAEKAEAERDALRASLWECADDLAAELNERYPPEMRAYPGNERRYQRDMEPVMRARELLGAESPERKKPRAATAGQGEG